MSYGTPTKHDGRAVLFALAELLVLLVAFLQSYLVHHACLSEVPFSLTFLPCCATA